MRGEKGWGFGDVQSEVDLRKGDFLYSLSLSLPMPLFLSPFLVPSRLHLLRSSVSRNVSQAMILWLSIPVSATLGWIPGLCIV